MDRVTENWDNILLSMKKEYQISEIQFNTWLKPLKLYSVEGSIVTIIVPANLNVMGLNYISSHYTVFMQVTISVIAEMEECEVHFILENDVPKKQVTTYDDHINNERLKKANLNPRYTFETFVVGSNNKFAQAASLAIAEKPGIVYNPFFIYGGAGLGKTHLMQSIGHYIIEQNMDLNVLYVNSEDFTNELIGAIRNGNHAVISQFRDKYRNVDVLLIDDIQFIIGKESTQEEFFHTFNTLYDAKKQIVITSDKPPKDMDILEERFRSRFEWGLIADISRPDYETRMAILHKKEEMDNCNIDEEIIRYIAENVKTNIRELEGALNKIIAKSKLENKEITMELAQIVLMDIISPSVRKTIDISTIVSAVSDYYQIPEEEIRGKKRTIKIAYPRQIAMFLCREMTTSTLKSIGAYFGDRDHTTVMNAINNISNDISTDAVLKQDIDNLKLKIMPS